MSVNYESWGRYPKVQNQRVLRINWPDELGNLSDYKDNILAYGMGRSYGDVCSNSDGLLIDTTGLNKFIDIDFEKGIIKAQAGVLLSDILSVSIPRGWFLSVTPGTKFVTLGGAIANDVHGKNHHKAGTFGCHVNSFNLLRSDGIIYKCSNDENPNLFKATIGGLGLTGIILDVEFRMQKIPGRDIQASFIKFDNLDEFDEITKVNDTNFDYTVSWVDCTSTGSQLGRGIYSAGNFIEGALNKPSNNKPPAFPFDYPFINPATVKLFNMLYFNKQFNRKVDVRIDYNPFFYPLDAIDNWNKAYGKNGFLQYQFVIPFESGIEGLKLILKKVADSGMSSFLTVLKTFGSIKSPGILSFPRPGYTMAIDFRMDGERTLKLLKVLDSIVKEFDGILYPAKDGRMSSNDFTLFYPDYKNYLNYVDEKFSSGFYERVIKMS